MLKEAIDRLLEIATRAVPVGTPIYEDSTKIVLGMQTTQELVIKEISKPVMTRGHSFSTLEGFLDYLNSAHTEKDHGIIFVGEKLVRANLRYDQAIEHHNVMLELEESDELTALRKLFEGVYQKNLWRMLITDLDGHIDDDLLLSIAQLSMASKAESEAVIDATGIVAGSQSNQVAIMFKSKNDASERANLRVDWIFHGRMWACFKREYDVRLRLELDATSSGLRFIFHARGLEDVLSAARADLVSEIDTKIPKDRFTVHEGSL